MPLFLALKFFPPAPHYTYFSYHSFSRRILGRLMKFYQTLRRRPAMTGERMSSATILTRGGIMGTLVAFPAIPLVVGGQAFSFISDRGRLTDWTFVTSPFLTRFLNFTPTHPLKGEVITAAQTLAFHASQRPTPRR